MTLIPPSDGGYDAICQGCNLFKCALANNPSV